MSKARTVTEECLSDLIILDILLPDDDGLSYCEELRGKSGVRILFLNALSTKEDVLVGLRVGGDDCITKLYDMDELLLRAEALLRRGKLIGRETHPLRLYGLELDFGCPRTLFYGRDILLKPKEFALLAVLANEPGRTVPVEELYEKVWGMDMAGDAHTVKEHISRVRSKLGKESELSIVSERGKGYRLQPFDTVLP